MILLGASNLTGGLPQVVEAVGARLGAPLEILAAIGHGRAFGLPSRYLARGLSAILDCGLWEHLGERPVHALVADFGNDLMYGASPSQTAEWVDLALGRLPNGSRVALMLPPLARLRRLGGTGYRLARNLFYPGRSLGREQALLAVEELCERLQAIARGRAIEVVEPPSSWYGIDPIHVARGQRRAAWQRVVEGWGVEAVGGHPMGGRERLRLRSARAERRTLFGFELRRSQPAARLADGSRLWLF